MTPRFHPLTIDDVRPECEDAVSVRFRVPDALRHDYAFTQGQHVALRARVDGEELRRSYSICAAPEDGELRVAIRVVPGGRFSGWAARSLQAGMTLDVLTPDGRFFTPLDPAHRKHYVAFAAGSGITPILSLVGATLKREPHSRFTLVYGNRTVASTMFLEALEDLKDRHLGRFVLHTVFSREHQDIDLFNGRLDAAKVRAFAERLIPPESIDEAFVCGPGAMIDEVEGALLGLGMPPERVHVERFGVPVESIAPAPVAVADTPAATLIVELDGIRRTVPFARSDVSVLDAALRAGLDLPYSCKGGMCCTCRGKVLEGEVRMTKNYSLDAAEVAAGFVLTCQARPLTERVVVSYDER
jgi:ring-1,2-phenylacetyl-CoA epoxidase subunit PaaE